MDGGLLVLVPALRRRRVGERVPVARLVRVDMHRQDELDVRLERRDLVLRPGLLGLGLHRGVVLRHRLPVRALHLRALELDLAVSARSGSLLAALLCLNRAERSSSPSQVSSGGGAASCH
ncbi:MAG: hypothetical protein IPG04_38360 [Polyangiaceae bacterium]|nr:hypothetical protein [Polyangiaceae bacterium]